jgi:hypothetical protein
MRDILRDAVTCVFVSAFPTEHYFVATVSHFTHYRCPAYRLIVNPSLHLCQYRPRTVLSPHHQRYYYLLVPPFLPSLSLPAFRASTDLRHYPALHY